MVLRQPDLPVSLAGHVATFVAKLDTIGAPWCSALGRFKLPTEMPDPLGWLPTHNVIRFVEDMARREGMPDLGVLVGQTDASGAMHPSILSAVREAPSLYAALRAVADLVHLQGSHIRIWLQATHNELLVRHQGSVVPEFPGAAHAEHFRVLGLLRLVRGFLGPAWQPTRMSLMTRTDPPRSLLRHVGHGCRVRTGADCGEIPVPLNRIGTAPPSTVPNLIAATGAAPDDWLARMQAVLATYLPSGGLKLAELAELASIKPRTFQRLMAERGTTYSDLLDRVRLDRARQLLEGSDLTITEVARAAGYTDTSNFARAFRRLTGRSPTQYRLDRLRAPG